MLAGDSVASQRWMNFSNQSSGFGAYSVQTNKQIVFL